MNSSLVHRRPVLLLASLVALLGTLGRPQAIAETIYKVRQTYSVKDLPEGAKQVRGWFWMPENRPEQQVLDFRIVEAPESFRITRDPRYGRSWLYAEAAADPQKPLRIATQVATFCGARNASRCRSRRRRVARS